MDNIQENLQKNIQENLPANLDEAREGFERAHEREEEAVGNAKEGFKKQANKLPVPTPPASVTSQRASALELKTRLMWGEMGLTILDVRDHDAFGHCRLRGAMNMPLEMLPDAAQFSLSRKRDIYVYGNDDAETANAAQLLRQAGFTHVTELAGGMSAWQEIGGAVDGIDTTGGPGPGAYNIFSRLKEFAEERARERRMASTTKTR